MALKSYNVAKWYWVVDGSTTQVYSSAAAAFVPVTDATYVAWLKQPPPATKISLADLSDVLSKAGLPLPPAGSTSDAQKNVFFDNIPQAVRVWAFAVENRVRALEGQPTRSVAQFKSYVKSLIT